MRRWAGCCGSTFSWANYVEAGSVLASITNLHGERLAVMRAPHGGLVAAVRHFVSVNPGDLVFALYLRALQELGLDMFARHSFP